MVHRPSAPPARAHSAARRLTALLTDAGQQLPAGPVAGHVALAPASSAERELLGDLLEQPQLGAPVVAVRRGRPVEPAGRRTARGVVLVGRTVAVFPPAGAITQDNGVGFWGSS